MERKDIYPIGQQSFETLRRGKALYIDKTEFIWRIVVSQSKYFFLARPRRFGKSLFLSALQCFFEAKRDLFKGLYIDSTDWEWETYPVLRLDLNTERYADKEALDSVVNNLFREWELRFDVKIIDPRPSARFKNIIEAAHEKTGKQVVILVDEYDKPIVGNLNKSDNFEHYRANLASLYSNFKSCADHIRLVFLTGVSRFSKLSVFSDLNNLNDITFDNQFADICGISEKELHDNFRMGINAMAEKHGKTYEQIAIDLKKNYDGYRFAIEGSEMYNPWSLLNAMAKMEIADYWNDTGWPSLIAETLKRMEVDLSKFFHVKARRSEMGGLDLESPMPVALLYQTGYLTIKYYDARRQRYTLGIPNEEVKRGLLDCLLPYYVRITQAAGADSYVWSFVDFLEDGDPEGFMRRLRVFFASIEYPMRMDDENNFHNAVYVFLTLVGMKVRTEVPTSDGRIDLLIETDDYIYIIELKYDGTPEEALRQIEEKQYALRYSADSRRIYRIGASFSSKTRRIDDWKIETGKT